MYFEKDYIINQDFMCMGSIFDRNARICTIIRETTRILIVDRSPLEILDDSIKSIGYNLRGAMETAKWHMGHNYMCPLMVNPVHDIVVFPSKAPKHIDTIWFNPLHIARTSSVKLQTQVKFTNESTIIVPSKLSSFNTKLQNAEQFRKLIKIAA